MVDYSELNGYSSRELRMKTTIQRIGISQVVNAVVCIILGVTAFTQENFMTYYEVKQLGLREYRTDPYLLGAGASFWVIVAGSIAIGLICCKSYRSTLIAHIVLASIALVSDFSAMMYAIGGMQNGYTGGLQISFYILLVANFILLIVSITNASKLVCSCCRFQRNLENTFVQQPVIMIQQPHTGLPIQQPNGVMMQQPNGMVMIQQPNGVMVQQPNGMMVQQPNGVMVQQANGMMVQQPNGMMVQQPNGVMVQQANGMVMMQQPQAVVQQNNKQTESTVTEPANNQTNQLEKTDAPPSYS